MSVTAELWTCPTCEVTETLDDTDPFGSRRRAQHGHAARHSAERRRAGPLIGAIVDAVEQVATFRVRLVVAPRDLERVREQVKRRGAPIEVYADSALTPGTGYVMTPRRGVRDNRPSPGVDNSGDDRGNGAA